VASTITYSRIKGIKLGSEAHGRMTRKTKMVILLTKVILVNECLVTHLLQRFQRYFERPEGPRCGSIVNDERFGGREYFFKDEQYCVRIPVKVL
jgi:hypothetical protein